MADKANSKLCWAISMFLVTMTGWVQGATITIGPGADYDFDSIQDGIDTAIDGDTVLVAPGEYVITEPITFRGKTITVKSKAGPDETIIWMGTPTDTNRGSVVVFENNETDASVLDGFTITGGTGCRLWAAKIGAAPRFWWQGGGILFNASFGTVRSCVIVQNRAEAGGGVSVCSGASAILTSCIINENSVTDPEGAGAGVLCFDNSSVTITECIIRDNSSIGAGGGVISYLNSSVTMTNCEILSNTTGRLGGGIYVIVGSATLTNCVIAGNTGAWGGGGVAASYEQAFIEVTNCTITDNSGAADAGGGGVLSYGVAPTGVGSITITNSIIWGNTSAKGREISLMGGEIISVAYSNVAGGQVGVNVEGGTTLDWGPGNIDADPLFARLGNWDNKGTRDPSDDIWMSGDFHLKSQAGRWDSDSQTWIQDDVTSPCIDTGDPMRPIARESFPNGGFVNMGAYGGTPKASKSYFGEPVCETIVAGDINGDGKVNRADLEIMALHWTDDVPLPLQ